MSATDDLVFPVLCFAKDGSLSPIETLQELTSPPRELVERHYFEGLTIVDSSALLYTVESAVAQERKGFASFLRSTLGGTVVVELTFSPSRRAVDAEALKQILLRDLPRWEDKEAAQDYRDSLENFATVQEIIADWFPPAKKEN